MNLTVLYQHANNKRRFCLLFFEMSKRYMTNTSRATTDNLIEQCYAILEVDPSCRDETIIRKSYLEKVKQYHPDSPFHDKQGNQDKFHQIQQAYEILTNSLKSNNINEESANEENVEIKFDIRHTAPQHRTHLEYGGFGAGTPSQRQAAFYKMRAEKAYERVYEYRRDRESTETKQELIERKKRKDVRATNFIDRLVEDLIQESMSRGDFNNIRSSGKSLHERNPHYMDFTTYKMNEILIDNGYIPEWILLEKQVRQGIEDARIKLKRVFKMYSIEHSSSSDNFKTELLNNKKWIEAAEKFRSDIVDINLNINKLNLIVPMLWRQQVHYNVEQEIEKILALDPLKIELPPTNEELSLINQQKMDKLNQEWMNHQDKQRYTFADAIKDFIQAIKTFKI